MLHVPTPEELERARNTLRGVVGASPLLPFGTTGGGDRSRRVLLKLENLQPTGSYKLRGATCAVAALTDAQLEEGVLTASAGNFAQGIAWAARRRDVPCRVVVPDHAPRAKLDALRALGAELFAVPFERWWRVLLERRFEDVPGAFVHPVCEQPVLAGGGTVGLEIHERCPDAAVVLVPYGGGGLACGIAAALRAVGSRAIVLACEVATAAPLAAAFEAGEPVAIERRTSFVDGIGSGSVLPEMWPLAEELLAGSIVVEPEAVARHLRRLALEVKVVAEGAGAVPVAAALEELPSADPPPGDVVCVVTGGNLDPEVLAAVLGGATP